MKTVGISAAGGVGRATAERIINKLFPYDMYELEICRFLGLHNNRKFLRDRSREVPGNIATCTDLTMNHIVVLVKQHNLC